MRSILVLKWPWKELRRNQLVKNKLNFPEPNSNNVVIKRNCKGELSNSQTQTANPFHMPYLARVRRHVSFICSTIVKLSWRDRSQRKGFLPTFNLGPWKYEAFNVWQPKYSVQIFNEIPTSKGWLECIMQIGFMWQFAKFLRLQKCMDKYYNSQMHFNELIFLKCIELALEK